MSFYFVLLFYLYSSYLFLAASAVKPDNLISLDDDIFETDDTVSRLKWYFIPITPSRPLYFKYFAVIETDEIIFKAHFNEVSEDEFAEVRRTILKAISNFKGFFGLTKLDKNVTLDLFLFNNIRDYRNFNFYNYIDPRHSVMLDRDTTFEFVAYDLNYWIFATKNDTDSLNHALARALIYYAVGFKRFKSSCVWGVIKEGVSEYYELLSNAADKRASDSHIEHTFKVMVNTETKNNEYDQIIEILNGGEDDMKCGKVDIRAVGYSLVSYLQEKNFTLIKSLFEELSNRTNTCYDSYKLANDLNEDYDLDFKAWLRNKHIELSSRADSELMFKKYSEALPRIEIVKDLENEVHSPNSQVQLIQSKLFLFVFISASLLMNKLNT